MTTINWYYCFTILIVACGGIPKGYDEGGYSSSINLPSFQHDFHLEPKAWKSDPSGLANRKANITSLGVLGAAFGALFTLYCNDRFGRLVFWRAAMLFWAGGIIMQLFASGIYGFLLFARIWTGLGAGALTAVTPMFLSEIAETSRRGMVVTCYMAMLLLAFTVGSLYMFVALACLLLLTVLGFFINYGATLHLSNSTPLQYRLVQAVPLIPTGIAFILSFMLNESPRWLAANGQTAQARCALARLRHRDINDLSVETELCSMQSQIQLLVEDAKAKGNVLSVARKTFTTRTLRSRILLSWTMQAVAQWSGGQGISFYMPQIFTYAGVHTNSGSLISSGAYGVVKLVVTVLFAIFFVDYFGRRPCFMVGLAMQMVAHIYLAAYIGVHPTDGNASNAAIAAIFVYAIGWSVGLCTVQFIYATEIFPTNIRSFAYGTTVCLHWLFQFAVVRVTPVMFVHLRVWGAFAFFACVCAIGLILLGVWTPETKKIPMESMEELFESKWYLGFKANLRDSSELLDAKDHRVTAINDTREREH